MSTTRSTGPEPAPSTKIRLDAPILLFVGYTPLLMATSVLITLPCLVVFFVAQKQITNGITFTGGR